MKEIAFIIISGLTMLSSAYAGGDPWSSCANLQILIGNTTDKVCLLKDYHMDGKLPILSAAPQ